MIIHVYDGKWEGDTIYPDIQKAYNRMKNLFACGDLELPAKIVVHEGTYRLTQPLHFSEEFPVTIEAAEGEKPVLSGAMEVTGWTKCKINGVSALRTVLPPEIKDLPFFYVDGKLAQPARYPKTDFLRVTDERTGFSTGAYDYDNFHYEEGDFNPEWYDPQNIRITMTHLWIGEYFKIESFDAEERKIVTDSCIRYVAQKANTEYYFSNVREALSEPGEYYFDRNTRELFYIPEKKKKSFVAEIPMIGTLARFDSGVRNVTLKGLIFRGGGNYMPLFGAGKNNSGQGLDLHDTGFATLPFSKERPGDPRKKDFYAGAQGATHLPGVLFFDHASDCVVEDCEICGCSWYGVQAYQACTRLTFRNNHLHDLGGGGFILNGVNYAAEQKEPALQVTKIIIKGNHIHDCGQFYLASIGIITQHAWGCLLEDNHIHDLYYSGISCGWVWGYANSAAREIRIHHNHIHDLGKKILSDMGGVYLLGIQPGTRVWGNTIHHISSRYYGGWGLYTDEGSSHIVLERNVVYKCDCNGYHQHYGRENIVRWNIFAFNNSSAWVVSHDSNFQGYQVPGEKHSKAISFINNVFITDNRTSAQLKTKDLFVNKKVYADGNIYYDISGKKKKFFGYYYDNDANEARELTMKQWQEAGFDRHSIFADPGFRDMENFDFTLKEDSILRDYGFEETVDAVE